MTAVGEMAGLGAPTPPDEAIRVSGAVERAEASGPDGAMSRVWESRWRLRPLLARVVGALLGDASSPQVMLATGSYPAPLSAYAVRTGKSGGGSTRLGAVMANPHLAGLSGEPSRA